VKIELSLFGAFRDYDPSARISLEIADDARVSELRDAVAAYGVAHWPDFRPGLLARSAFASDASVLRDAETLPREGRMAVLPPVSGG
jgi:molybdopterin synthase sulfur carrier subunit